MSKTYQSLAGGFDKSNLTALDNSDTANFLVETSATDRVITKYLRSIPGSDAIMSTGNYRALHYVNDTLYAVKDNEFGIVDLDNNTFYKIVAVDGYHDISITHTGVPTPYVVVSDGAYLYACNTTETIGQQQANYKTIVCPPNTTPGPLAYLYGYIMMLDESSGKIFYSYQYPWDKEYTYVGFEADDIFALKWKNDEGEYVNEEGQYFLAEWKPDVTLRLHEAKNSVIAVGTKTMQCFTYTGAAFLSQPWATTDSSAVSYGGDISVVIDDSVFAYSPDKGVYAYNGTTASKVSTLDIDRDMKSRTPVRAFKVTLDGHDMAVFDFNDRTYAYDGNWIRLETLSLGNPGKWRYISAVRVGADTYLGHSAGLAKVNLNKFTEHDGNPIRRYRRGKVWERTNQLIQLDSLEIIANVGQTDRLVTDGVAHVSFCRDGAANSVTKELKLPCTGHYNRKLMLYRLGVGRVWDVSIECSDNAPFAIYGVVTDFDDCLQENME